MQQAARISDKTAFFLSGEVVEYTDTNKLFTTPSDKRTEDYSYRPIRLMSLARLRANTLLTEGISYFLPHLN
ncbi:hypothetical protein ACT7DO_11350 [Bacillus pacificus]